MKNHAIHLLALVCLGLAITPARAEPAADALIRQTLEGQKNGCPELALSRDGTLRQQLARLYQPRAFRPLWNDPARRQQLQEQLEALADDGLEPARYRLASSGNPSCQDLRASQAYLLALRHLALGRVDQDSLEPVWRAPGYSRKTPDLLKIARQGLEQPAEAFAQARPDLDLYRQLRQAHARLRRELLPHWPDIPSGSPLKPDMQDLRVPLLEQRLAGHLDSPDSRASAALHYYPALVTALQHFQRQHGLQPDGVLGPATRRALNTPFPARLAQLRINLERLRWMARDMDPDILLVNVAGARLLDYRNGRLVWETRTQVGRAERATPLLKSAITRLTLNPTWTVPPTILREDKLPKIRQNPGFLEKHQIRVLDAHGQPVNPARIDWSNPQALTLRQDAGPGNPLGQVVLRFANPFFVYLHDTPSQGLFSRAPRAFSSGCVRVESARKLADRLLTDPEKPVVKALLASGRTSQYSLAQPRPLLISYWTAEADSQGEVRWLQDIYQHDPALLAALEAASRE